MIKDRILVVDNDELMLEVCQSMLAELADVEVLLDTDGQHAAEFLNSESVDLLLTDMRLPGKNGLDLLRLGRKADPELPVVVMTGFPSPENAVQCMKHGAAAYLIKPFSNAELLKTITACLQARTLRDENRLLRRQVERSYCWDEILTRSSVMEQACSKIRRASEADFEVFILGEPGTGREFVARSIHRESARGDGPFVSVNCAAIPEELLEREFFGYERGAFIGAKMRSLGWLEYAHRGTLFLTEPNQCPLRLQDKLIGALQQHKFCRLGSSREIQFDIRIICASAVSLDEEVRQGRFRPDLYQRLNAFRIELLPLRQRSEDIPLLATRFLERFCTELDRPTPTLSADALEVLQSYSWPGNVRELENTLRRALARAKTGSNIGPDDLPPEVVIRADAGVSNANHDGLFAERERHMRRFERDYLLDLLRDCSGDVESAARQARMPRASLYELLKRHGLAKPQGR